MELVELCSTCSKKCKIKIKVKPVSFYCPKYKPKNNKNNKIGKNNR